jgi:hypothetical protein
VTKAQALRTEGSVTPKKVGWMVHNKKNKVEKIVGICLRNLHNFFSENVSDRVKTFSAGYFSLNIGAYKRHRTDNLKRNDSSNADFMSFPRFFAKTSYKIEDKKHNILARRKKNI